MILTRRQAGAAALLFGLALAASHALAQTAEPQPAPAATAPMPPEPIRLGDLAPYGSYAPFTEPYRNGWRMALEELNAAGGALGRGFEVVSRDDGGTAADAVEAAEALVRQDKVVLLFGTFTADAALGVAAFAGQNEVPFVATLPVADALTLNRGNRFTFRPLRASAYMQTAMLADAMRGIDATRWAIVAPNYDYGLSTAETFKSLMAELNSDAEIVAEHYAPLGRIDAVEAVSALAAAKPDAIFSALFGGDLAAFARAGKAQGLFASATLVNPLAGEPEWLALLGADVPEGAIVTGYAPEAISEAPHKQFVDAYRSKYAAQPTMGALIGYMTGHWIKALIEKAGSTEAAKLVEAAENLSVDTMLGPVSIRSSDRQGTVGTFVGRLAVENGKGVMSEPVYVDGAEFLPPEELVERLRPRR